MDGIRTSDFFAARVTSFDEFYNIPKIENKKVFN